MSGMYAVLRVRGEVGVNRDIRHTMELMRLHRANHMVILPKDKMRKKMIERAGDYLTYGEIDGKTLAALIEKRARLPGNRRIGGEFIKKSRAKGFGEIAESIMSGEKTLADFGIKPVFRLRPPRKGFERAGIKKAYSVGGALGYRGAKINKIIERMV